MLNECSERRLLSNRRGLNDETQKLGSTGRLDSPCDFSSFMREWDELSAFGEKSIECANETTLQARRIDMRAHRQAFSQHTFHSFGWCLVAAVFYGTMCIEDGSCIGVFIRILFVQCICIYEWHTQTLVPVVSSTLCYSLFSLSNRLQEENENRKTRSHYNSPVNNVSHVCNSSVRSEQSN